MLTVNVIIANIKKGQAAIQIRDLIKKLDTYYISIKDKIVITGCKLQKPATTVYLQLPSESTKDIMYDTVFEFNTIEKLTLDTKFKVFCNAPSFAYSFAYVFNLYGSLLFPEKYPIGFRKIAPKIKNPFLFSGFDKFVYSGIKYISEYGLVKIINERAGKIPVIKTFVEKQNEIGSVRAELKRTN